MSRELDPVVAACGCVNHFSGQVTHCALHRAAPDLVAALEAVVNEMRTWEADGSVDSFDAQGYDMRGCLIAARAAIRQAKGAS